MAAEHTTGHSIWLIPESPEYHTYQELINNFSSRTGTPVFSPHITLLGQLPHDLDWLTSRFTTCFQQQRSLHISLHQVELQDRYFRSIVLNVASNPALQGMHAQALACFQAEKMQPFEPHLSILYSDLTLPEKQALVNRHKISYPQNLSLSEVQLVDTSGSPDQWQVLLKRRLSPT